MCVWGVCVIACAGVGGREEEVFRLASTGHVSMFEPLVFNTIRARRHEQMHQRTTLTYTEVCRCFEGRFAPISYGVLLVV